MTKNYNSHKFSSNKRKVENKDKTIKNQQEQIESLEDDLQFLRNKNKKLCIEIDCVNEEHLKISKSKVEKEEFIHEIAQITQNLDTMHSKIIKDLEL